MLPSSTVNEEKTPPNNIGRGLFRNAILRGGRQSTDKWPKCTAKHTEHNVTKVKCVLLDMGVEGMHFCSEREHRAASTKQPSAQTKFGAVHPRGIVNKFGAIL